MKALSLTALFAGLIALANLLTTHYGILWGLVPAGTFAAGLTFAIRDWLQEVSSRWLVLLAVGLGAALSALVSPAALVTASGVTFVLSELADFGVYSALRKRSLWAAMLLSNTVGAVIDSIVFLYLADYPLSLWWSQALVKVAVTVPVMLWLGRKK